MRYPASVLLGCCLLLPTGPQASDSCAEGAAIDLSFESGSTWFACADIDPVHGLELSQLMWQAPGDRPRDVLAHVHVASVLNHRHDQTTVSALFDTAASLPSHPDCRGDELVFTTGTACIVKQQSRMLSKFGSLRGVHGAHWHISASQNFGNSRLEVSFELGENGRIGAELSLAATPLHSDDAARRGQRLAVSATESSTRISWRIEPNIDGGAADAIEEYDFVLDPTLGSRRPMTVRPIDTETLRRVDHRAFRGWRLYDPSGSGYYLDSQHSSRGWFAHLPNWARFDVAVTRDRTGERHASSSVDGDASLDLWVNGETLRDHPPVLWYSQSLPIEAHRGNRSTRFSLLPFDWSGSTPFPLEQNSQ